MGLEINKGPNDFCKIDCPYMKLELKTDEVLTKDQILYSHREIVCAHEEICTMWIAEN